MKKVTFKTFQKFMKEHDAWNKYVANFERSRGKLPECHFIRRAGKDSWIDGAFIWEGTPEEKEYWKQINRLWQDTLQSVNE